RPVAPIRLGRLENILHREAPPPGFAPRFLGGEELVEIDRRHLRPDAARAAEVGDPRLGADAGAGEDHRTLRPLDQLGEGGDAIVVVHGPYSRKCAGTRQARREPAKLRPMTKLLLVRHGHVEGISPERFRGRAELKLTASGRREAELTAARIAATWRPAASYTSPMGRCADTGMASGTPCGL